MPSLGDVDLSSVERALVEAALRADPALAEELELIDCQLEPGARLRFWRAFAGGCAEGRRPAAAVLAALEQAALGARS